MAAVLAGEARRVHAQLVALAVALACLLAPSAAAAQLPDVGATAEAASAAVASAAPAAPAVTPPPQAAEVVNQVVAPVRQAADRVTRQAAAAVPAARAVEQAVQPAPEPAAPPAAPAPQRTERAVPDPARSPSPGSRTRSPQGVVPHPEQVASPASRSRAAAPVPAAAESLRAARPDASTPLSEVPVPELPTTPSGGASAAPAGVAFAGFCALFGTAALLLLGASHRLHLRPAAMRPAPFLALLERPG